MTKHDLTGTIVAAHGRHYLADVDGEFLQCVTRGKKTNVAVGDIVHLKRTSNDQAVIEKIAERTTLLYRSDQYKSKLLAANITRLFIVIATEPSFADDLVSRALVACEAAGVDAHLILNKVDLEPNLARARERASLYTNLGYPLHEVSAKTHPDDTVAALTPLLQDQSSILIGQSGMGKSSLATNIAFHIANSYEPAPQADGSFKAANGGVVGLFSLEMSSEQLATRIISEQTEIPSSKIRRGDLTEADFNKLVAYTQENHKRPLFIDQTGGISIAQLSARARRLKRQRGLDLIIIDYIQLMTGSGKRGSENRVQEITEITTGLKALAKELGVPIIALSQLSRQVESRDDKRPQLSDLRESGSIEQDADVVIFVYRDEYYLKNKEPDRGSPEHLTWEEKMRDVQGKAEVIIGKQRHGPTGTVPMGFQGEFTRFFDLAEDSHLPERFE